MPCNQFAGQEPGNDSEIAEFCERNFGVTFPLTAKANVRGKDQHPLYAELTKFKTGMLPGLVKWNFEKFLVNRDGRGGGTLRPHRRTGLRRSHWTPSKRLWPNLTCRNDASADSESLILLPFSNLAGGEFTQNFPKIWFDNSY